jgi:hypothetical protein
MYWGNIHGGFNARSTTTKSLKKDYRAYYWDKRIAHSKMNTAGWNEAVYYQAMRIEKEAELNMKRIVRILRRFDNVEG